MRTIAIVLCDNDFGNTFKNLLETMIWVLTHSNSKTEEEIKRIIYEGIRFHYIAFQLDRDMEHDLESTVEYLTKKIKILFDDDAEKAYQELDHDGGSWILNVQQGIVESF